VNSKAIQIVDLLTPAVQALGFELLGADYLPAPGGATLRLYIDVPPGSAAERYINVDDCEQVSHEVSALLDVEEPITGHYTLEVSSPGLDRPLFTLEQCARHLQQDVKLWLKLPLAGRRRLQGTLTAVDHEHATITLVVADIASPLNIVFDTIDRVRIVPDWAALGLGPARPAGNKPKRKARQSIRPSTPGQPLTQGGVIEL